MDLGCGSKDGQILIELGLEQNDRLKPSCGGKCPSNEGTNEVLALSNAKGERFSMLVVFWLQVERTVLRIQNGRLVNIS